jgi:hypothetical protein
VRVVVVKRLTRLSSKQFVTQQQPRESRYVTLTELAPTRDAKEDLVAKSARKSLPVVQPGRSGSGKSVKGVARIRVGDTLTRRHIDILTKGLLSIRARAGFECSGPLCVCTGDDDCNDMFTTGLCGDAICFETADGGVVCLCVRAGRQ